MIEEFFKMLYFSFKNLSCLRVPEKSLNHKLQSLKIACWGFGRLTFYVKLLG